jgi:hypothetical protein
MKKLLSYYGRIENPYSGDYERAETTYPRGSGGKIVNPAKAYINGNLLQRLGKRRAAPYLIEPLERIPGTRRRRFGLRLRPSDIRIGACTGGDTNAAIDEYATARGAPNPRPDNSDRVPGTRKNGGTSP